MKPSYFFILAVLVMNTFTSCESDDDESSFEIEKVQVIEIDAPSSVLLGEEITIKVDFIVYNGCGQFGRFDEKVQGTTNTIAVEAKYVGDICTSDIPTRTIDYTFIPQTAGDYVFRFLTFDGAYINANVRVR